jgi:hypothetical protein
MEERNIAEEPRAAEILRELREETKGLRAEAE